MAHSDEVDAPVTIRPWMADVDPAAVPGTPCWVVDLVQLERNLHALADVQEKAGCKILIAFKGFAAHATFPLIRSYLSGAAVSSPHEAMLASEYGFPEIHAYAPAYSTGDIDVIVPLVDHIVFNSPGQLLQHGRQVRNAGISVGLRVNPEHREVDVALYDPSAPCSRLGTVREQMPKPEKLDIDGLHVHALCESGADALERLVRAFEEKFEHYFSRIAWVNFGGGHHITRDDYNRDLLIETVRAFQARHDLPVYLEPGEAIAIGSGVLVTTVLDIVHNHVDIAILDTSATAHMPDVLEMPYRPEIVGAGRPGQKAHTYRLGGLTCLAGDVIGDYSFDQPLKPGDRLIFCDMAHYTMVKTSNFNGVRLPGIALRHPDKRIEVVKTFAYESYRDRLG